MDLTPLKLYRTLYQYKEKSDASVLFKRICNDLINERINILRSFGLLSFFGGETSIKKSLSNLTVPSDVERENDLNELVQSVLKAFINKLKTESYDFRPLIGFLKGKPFNKATFTTLDKTLSSLPKTSQAYLSNKLKNEPCCLLTSEFKELKHYREVSELADLVYNQLTSGRAYDAVNGRSTTKRASFITQCLVPEYHFLTKEQADKILNEAAQSYALIAKEIRNRSTRAGIIGFICSSLIYFFAFFFLSLLATSWGYSQFGSTATGKLTDFTSYKDALFGMIFILPTFFLATYFGSYERRWALRHYESHVIFQVAPRIIPSATLIAHAIVLFNLTKNAPGDAANNIFNKVFYLGDKGYTLAIIYLFMAATNLIMDLFSMPQKSDLRKWNSEGYPPGRLWLTQNGALYIIPFMFTLRLFMPAIHLSIMVAFVILTFLFGFIIPLALFLIQFYQNREQKDGLDTICSIDSFALRRGILAAAIFAAVMVFVYLMMTHVHANPDWFKGKWSFFVNLGWFVLILIIIAACLVGLAQLTGLDAGAGDDTYLDISPSFYFFIVGFILTFFIIPKGSDLSPNIYYLGWGNGPVITFIILLMILSVAHDVCCFFSGEYEFEDGLVSTRVSNLGFIIAAIVLYIMTQAMHLFPIYVLAIVTPILLGGYYYFAMGDNDCLAVI